MNINFTSNNCNIRTAKLISILIKLCRCLFEKTVDYSDKHRLSQEAEKQTCVCLSD